MHKSHLFNIEKSACHYNNLYINELRSILTYDLVSNGYFYIQWMFPVIGKSKWHTNIEPFEKEDNTLLIRDDFAINNILESSDLILNYFSIKRTNFKYEYLNHNNDYWLRGIGHEEKKISRIAICLMQIGLNELAESLIKTSCEILELKGFKTGGNTKKVINFWIELTNKHTLY